MKRQWDEDELAEQWTLTPEELALLANKAGPTRLGFAVLLEVFARDGRFPRSRQEVAGAVVVYLAKQVGVSAEQYLQYDRTGRAIKHHRAQIRAFFGFREATVQDAQALVSWLLGSQVPHEQRLDQLREAAYGWCRGNHLEPPTPDRPERLIRSALRTYDERLCRTVLERLGAEMNIERQYVDSHGQSEVAFGLTRLLGFQLLPRLKAIGVQKLYRPEAGQIEAYPRLAPVLTRPINWQLIRQQYDELIKYATALRLGTADAEAILRRFTRSAPQHPTYQGLAELEGRQDHLPVPLPVLGGAAA